MHRPTPATQLLQLDRSCLVAQPAPVAGLEALSLPCPPPHPLPARQAIKVYASSAGSGAADLLSGPAGKAAVSAHVIPNVALSLDDLPEGNSTYPTVAGQPLIVTKK